MQECDTYFSNDAEGHLVHRDAPYAVTPAEFDDRDGAKTAELCRERA